MSRSGGFGNADLATGFFDDAKVKRLVRSTRDEALVARSLIGYLAVLAASWGEGERVALEDAAPIWLTALDDLAERLVDSQLLDAEHRIPIRSWNGWYTPARQRRDDRHLEGMIGGLMRSLGLSRPDAEVEARLRIGEQVSGRSTSGPPSTPLTLSVPSVPSVPSEPGIPPPPAKRGRRIDETNPRANGTAPRDTGTNLRANGKSPRQERAAEKRGGFEDVRAITRRIAEGPAVTDPDLAAREPIQ